MKKRTLSFVLALIMLLGLFPAAAFADDGASGGAPAAAVEPVQPAAEPVQPADEPAQPSAEPAQPSVEPAQPSAEPAQPSEAPAPSPSASPVPGGEAGADEPGGNKDAEEDEPVEEEPEEDELLPEGPGAGSQQAQANAAPPSMVDGNGFMNIPEGAGDEGIPFL